MPTPSPKISLGRAKKNTPQKPRSGTAQQTDRKLRRVQQTDNYASCKQILNGRTDSAIATVADYIYSGNYAKATAWLADFIQDREPRIVRDAFDVVLPSFDSDEQTKNRRFLCSRLIETARKLEARAEEAERKQQAKSRRSIWDGTDAHG